MKTLTIIDTFGFFFRSYYALPNLRNKEGFPTGLITGFANFIYTLREEYETDYILFALDAKGKNFRHEIDPNYKVNRSPAPEDLKTQLPVVIEWIKKMGFESFVQEGFEADDVIAAAVKFAKNRDIKVRIVTHDKDLYQLIDEKRVSIFDPIKKVQIDRDGCFEKFGVYPEKIGDFLSLVGDAADNIPGVKGVGAKGAKKLLEDFDSIEEIYKNIEKVANPRSKRLLKEGKQSAFLSKRLVKLDDNIEISDRFESFSFPENQPLECIVDELEKYGLRSMLSRLNRTPKKEETIVFEPILLDTREKLFAIVDKLICGDVVAFDTETTGLNARSARIVGFSFATDEKKAYYAPIAHNYLGVGRQVSLEDSKKAIEKIFTCRVVGHNLKYDFAIIKHNLISSHVECFEDTMILAWLLNPGQRVGLDSLAKHFFDYDMVKFKQVVPKGEDFSAVDIDDACRYASEDAWMTLKLYNKLTKTLEPKLLNLAREIEFLFIETLLEMEQEGIKVDTVYFKQLETKTSSMVEKLKIDIFALSGTQFNLNSPKQLGVVLFEHLKLPVAKKTKTGYSTDESVLKKLLDRHSVIPKILEYRELHKLLSTYIKPLLRLASESEDSRIHTSFLQTGTATGRLSSKDPNLQNIPTRSKLGREVRDGFISKDGYSLISIDYSQIELRLLAHYSEDADLLDAFNMGLDIHRQTALKLFGEEEADEKRGVAKSINFGLLYGMGARKLSQTIKVSQKEAKEYIDNYFKSFSTVKSYLESIKDSAKETGFVETLLGRRRYFDFENANAMQLSMYEREAVNTRFQGSAADLMKLSMNKIGDEILSEDSKLLLQIHDELIFEVKDSEAKEFAKKAVDIMESIYKLKVKLEVSASIGKNWGELK